MSEAHAHLVARAQGADGPGRRQIIVGLLGAAAALLLAALDLTMISAALPTIVGEFHRPQLYGHVITAYLLAETVSTPLFAKAGDLYGRKRMLQVAIALFVLASVLCSLSQGIWQLIAFRALQGFAAGGLLALPVGIIADLIPARDRGRYQAWYASTFACGSIAGPLLGGALVDSVGWRAVFYVNLPLGLLALVVARRALPSSAVRRPVAIDWAGALLLAGGVAALVLMMSTAGNQYPWTSPVIAALAVATVALLVGFVIRERRAAEPVLPVQLFANRVFFVSTTLAFILGAVTFGPVLAFLPQFLQVASGHSATRAGLMLVPILACAVLSSLIAGQLVSRTGRYKHFPIVGMACLVVGLLLMSRIHTGVPYVQLAVPMVLLGAAAGLSTPILTLATQCAVQYRDVGVASASVTFFRSLGGAIGAALFGLLLTAQLNAALPRSITGFTGTVEDVIGTPDRVAALPADTRTGIGAAFASSLHDVFLAAAVVAAVAFVLSWFLREVRL